jgi:hypothetical protein
MAESMRELCRGLQALKNPPVSTRVEVRGLPRVLGSSLATLDGRTSLRRPPPAWPTSTYIRPAPCSLGARTLVHLGRTYL